MSNNVIFGAGKISRGFIAHLLDRSGEKFVFIEKDPELVRLINERGKYALYVFGAPEKNTVIKGAKAISCEDRDTVVKTLAAADVIYISVGGKNLEKLIPVITEALSQRLENDDCDLSNIVTCENWYSPAETLRKGILGILDEKYIATFEEKVGITESVILRTAIEADEEILKSDPLALNVSDFWEIPINGKGIKGELPKVEGFHLIKPFNAYLHRKLYTYNAASATISYLGYLKGYETLAEAAVDEDIKKVLMGVYEETCLALCNKFNVSSEEQRQLQHASYTKYKDKRIVDFLERNARDPIRKLGPNDRLIGPANLVLEYGGNPVHLATAIAAAVFYDHPADPIALQLRAKRETEGIDAILKDVCKIDPDGTLSLLVKEKIETLRSKGLIKDNK